MAENTRESYRKTSLKPLYEAGLITRHQLSTNDPNTFYRLHPDIYRALTTPQISLDQTTLERLRSRTPLGQKRGRRNGEEIQLLVAPGKYFVLSGGEHNELEQTNVERFGPTFLSKPRVVFVGDAARKAGYQDRVAMRELNLPIKVDQIAWGTAAWIASESNNLILFQKRVPAGKQ